MEVKERNGSKLFDELEQKLGVWTDSCVEDQIRCVIHFANNPESKKNGLILQKNGRLIVPKSAILKIDQQRLGMNELGILNPIGGSFNGIYPH